MNEEESQRKLGMVLVISAWGILLGLLTYFFHTWYSDQVNPNQVIIGRVLDNGAHEVRLEANHQSQYYASGKINGVETTFLLDTGATMVVVPYDLAMKLNLTLGPETKAQTAGGPITVYYSQVNDLEIGNILLRNITVNVSKAFNEEYVLLGMSVLKHLEIEHREDELILRLPARESR